jgi:Spy/CpxP family protein refolding chaperone
MVKFGMFLSAAFALAAFASPARPADESEMIAESGAMEIVLLRHQEVQKELKLTDVNTKKIDDFASQQWKKAKEIHQLPEEQQHSKWDTLSKENEKFLSEVLTPAQKKRLDQIGMQKAGLLWAGRPDMASALKLTSDQKKKIEEFQKGARKQATTIVKESKDNPTKTEEMKKLHETTRKELLSVLTPEQQEAWKGLAGPEFMAELHFLPPTKQ